MWLPLSLILITIASVGFLAGAYGFAASALLISLVALALDFFVGDRS